MFLPNKTKKIVTIFLLLTFFLVSSPISYAAQPSPQIVKPNQLNQDETYIVIPVSQIQQGVNGGATISANPEGGQVLGLLDALKEIGSIFKSGFEFFENAVTCLVNISCVVDGLLQVVEFAGMVFVKFGLSGIMGDKASNCALAASQLEGDNQPEDCEDIAAAMRGENVVLDPSDFGLLGITARTTTTALAIPLPLDSTTYLASINPFKPAHAALEKRSTGSVVLDIWKNTRNGALILLVVATVIVGFMIMFRFPLAPRVAVTLQNSLPRIAIAMLLIVFSFAIAGVMIDATRTIGNLSQSFLPPVSLGGIGVDGWGAILGMILLFILSIAGVLFVIFNVGGLVAVLLGMLILSVFLLIMFLMLTFKLVQRLVIFLLLVMFAPLFFLAGALPKGEGAVLYWFKRGAAALLSIPATAFVLSLALVIGTSGSDAFDLSFAAEGLGSGPIVDNAAGGIITAFSWSFASPIIGLVLLFFAVKTPDIVDELFGIKGLGSRASGGGAILGLPNSLGQSTKGLGRGITDISKWRGGNWIKNRLRPAKAGSGQDDDKPSTGPTDSSKARGLKVKWDRTGPANTQWSNPDQGQTQNDTPLDDDNRSGGVPT